MNGLIGYTGFVGSNLDKQYNFDKKYNSSNITEIEKENFDLLVCAGVRGTKWIANKYPDEDLINIKKLLNNLDTVNCKKIILISTVDVYKEPYNVNENDIINLEGHHTYGINRAMVEDYIKNKFKDYHIVRLPAIYGENIKKNFVFDLLNNHCLNWTHRDSKFQYYHLKNLWKDILKVIDSNIKVINFNSEPISGKELAKKCFNIDFNNITEKPPSSYNIKSIYSRLFNERSNYMYDKEEVFNDMKKFIVNYKNS